MFGSPGRKKYECSEWTLPRSTVRPAATSAWAATWPPNTRSRRPGRLSPRKMLTSIVSRSRRSTTLAVPALIVETVHFEPDGVLSHARRASSRGHEDAELRQARSLRGGFGDHDGLVARVAVRLLPRRGPRR